MCSFLISSHLVHQVSQNYQKKTMTPLLGHQVWFVKAENEIGVYKDTKDVS